MEKICSVEDCENKVHVISKMLCNKHNMRLTRHGDVNGGQIRLSREGKCSISYCDRPIKSGGMCYGHYQRKLKGQSQESPLKPKREKGQPGSLGKTKAGYMIRCFPEHPNATKARGMVMEHVRIMSDHIGRPLLPHESVHHKNGVRDDNRIENLELWSTSQPYGQRVEDKLAWAHEIIKLYENQ